MQQLPREAYLDIVKFTLNSMLDAEQDIEGYDFLADLRHYYTTTIKPQNMLTQDELLLLVEHVREQRRNTVREGEIKPLSEILDELKNRK
ncbi:hypothetical protein ACW5UC_24875 [Priestia aryabhattai]|uniref:hypothetical protein n=1 Tax=Priestia megaterium TaxID=1404 RepID=UPI003F9549E8